MQNILVLVLLLVVWCYWVGVLKKAEKDLFFFSFLCFDFIFLAFGAFRKMGFSGNKFFCCVNGIVRMKKRRRTMMMMCNGESALMFMKKEVINPRLFLSFHRLKVVLVMMEEDNVGVSM